MKNNVLMVANYSPDVGYAWWLMERFWKMIAAAQVERGAKTYLAYPDYQTKPVFDETLNIEVVKLEVQLDSADSRKQVYDFIRQNNISTLYFTDRSFFHSAYAGFRKAGIHNIVVHDHTPGDRPKITGLKRLLKRIRNSFSRYTADFVINVSPLMTQRSIDNACFPKAKCITVQNGIEPIELDSSVREAKRKELGLNPEDVVLVTSGRLHPYKRVDLVIKAFAYALANVDVPARLLVIGNGDESESLKALAHSLGVTENVHFLGFRSDTRDILQASDMAMHAALGEGFSLSITEYMSARLPVLVPDIPSVSQAINNEENGFIYSQNNYEDAAFYIAKLAQNENLRGAMGASAKKKADQSYSMSLCDSQFEKAIEKWCSNVPCKGKSL